MVEKTASNLNSNAAENSEIFILAAGLGKRLGEITKSVPKPLVKVCDRELLDWNLRVIKSNHFKKVYINLFYLPEKIKEFVADGSKWGLEVEFVEEKVLLDTGGAIKNIEARLTKEFLITINSDVLLDPSFSFSQLYLTHQKNNSLATLLLREDSNIAEYGEIIVNREGRIIKFLDIETKDFANTAKSQTKAMMYCGIQILGREIFTKMPAAGEVFSITKDIYRELIKNSEYITSCNYSGFWSDVGTPSRLDQASKEFRDLLKKGVTKN